MAGLLDKHRKTIVRELDVGQVVSHLVRRGVLTYREEAEVARAADPVRRAEVFVDVLSGKGVGAYQQFCESLEIFCPRLLTKFLLDKPGEFTVAIIEVTI